MIAPMRLVDRNEYFVITADDQARIVRFERTPLPFASLEAAQEAYERMLRLVQRERLSGQALLVDSRNGPGRNDQGFEQLLARYRDRLFAPFTRCAMLLRTQAGLMQSQRLARAHEVHVQLFQDEAEAVLYLRSELHGESRDR
jgi:hypothetical protein